MPEHGLVIPEPLYNHIGDMRYTGEELIDYYLSTEVLHEDKGYIATIPLVRLPMGTSRGISVEEEEPRLLQGLARFLASDETHSAVLLHFHSIKGPSGPDKGGMKERFRQNNRLSRYGIFVGPEGPTFYETDGQEVFPIRSKAGTIPNTEEIKSLQQKVSQEFARLFRAQR